MQDLKYRIVVPSRKRAKQMMQLCKLLPYATITVNEEEIEDYKPLIGEHNELVAHPKLHGIAPIRQWILDNFKEETIVMCDDDLKTVTCLVGERHRNYSDWTNIKTIIENQIHISRAFGIKLFYFNRNPRPLFFRPYDCIAFSGGFAAGIFGINGRELEFDSQLTTREDVDITLESLMKHRAILCDMRYYFIFEGTWSKKGGNQGIRTSENETLDKNHIYNKWGRNLIKLDVVAKGKHGTGKTMTGVTIRVKRRTI